MFELLFQNFLIMNSCSNKHRPVMTTTGLGASFFAEDVPSSGTKVVTIESLLGLLKFSIG